MKPSSILVMLLVTLSPLMPSNAWSDSVTDTSIDRIMSSSNFQGSVLVADQGQVIHHQGYGSAIREWDIPNTPETRFRIASLSKTFTATLVMMLVEEGRLDLDKSINTYLPDYPADYRETVTIRHLLTHRSGISRQFKIPGWTKGKSLVPTPKPEFLSMIASMPLEFTPNANRLYSSASYYILGAVIEAVTEQSYSAVLRAKILQPLAMTNSDIYQAGQIIPKLAHAYKPVRGKYSFCPPVSDEYCLGGQINLSLFHASGSMHATTDDLFKWDQALYHSQLLSRESKAYLFAEQTHAVWDVAEIPLSAGKNTKIMIAHGELEGYTSLMVRFPHEHRTIILLNNTGLSYDQLINIAHEIALVLYE